MNMKLKRLYNEYTEISERFAGNPYILIKETYGNPPEKYAIEYKVKGIVKVDNIINEKQSHLVEIVLPSEYPTVEPICRMLDPVFHPNVDINKICIADYWAASESLTDVIIRIGEIITFQNYNIKSPLNAEAAQWAGQNTNIFPIDAADFSYQNEIESKDDSDNEEQINPNSKVEQEHLNQECSNCRALGSDLVFHKCSHGHLTCSDCSPECQECGKALCVICPLNKCSTCGKVFCDECKYICPNCGKITCVEHIGECCICQCGAKGKDIKFQKCSNGHLACPDCILECGECGKTLCVSCNLITCSICGKILCSECKSVCDECGKITCNDHRNCCSEPWKSEVSVSSTPGLKENASLLYQFTCNKCGCAIEDLTAHFCVMCGNRIMQPKL